ncbi:MAG: hypothetical protein GSR84_04615 [Desulfurococcales archaeon]|nr:hypothetical protein [Desulfurococcales archaeon]
MKGCGICEISKKIECVILALDEGPATRTEIAMKAGVAGGVVGRVVNWLLERGLAEEKPVSRYRVEVRLTERGKHLANLIKEIQEIIGG